MGTEQIVADALDPSAVMNAVRQRKPEIAVHEITSIMKVDLRNFDRGFAATNRLRMEGADHLLAAARAAGVRRFIAQSFAGKPYAREGGWVKTAEDPLDGGNSLRKAMPRRTKLCYGCHLGTIALHDARHQPHDRQHEAPDPERPA